MPRHLVQSNQTFKINTVTNDTIIYTLYLIITRLVFMIRGVKIGILYLYIFEVVVEFYNCKIHVYYQFYFQIRHLILYVKRSKS